MLKFLFLLVGAFAIVFGQTWVSRARLRDHTGYFTNVMQETAYELEKRGWCNLKLVDISQNINLQMYNWLVNGTITYTNGFVISIQKIIVNNMNQLFTSSTVNGTEIPRATVRGRLNLNDVIVGYDVIANLTEIGVQRYTGDILHTDIIWEFSIIKNLHTEEIEVVHSLTSLSGGLIRMNYRPTNNITEVLSRNFLPGHNWDGVQAWGGNIFHPIIVDIVTNKIDFPEVCFSDC